LTLVKQMSSINGTEFWKLKQETDDIATRLGWSKAYCKRYIQSHYGCHTRLTMTDWQLNDLLTTLRQLQAKADTQKLLKKDRRNDRRKRR
jgi:hypothetical protein